MSKPDYSTIPENDVIKACKEGNEDAYEYILEKYKNYVRKRAREFFIIGGDTDDLIQEGMIGLYKAIRDYNPDKDTKFFTFAATCIGRQLITAVDASNCLKHSPLNHSISYDATVVNESGNESLLSETMIFANRGSLEDVFIDRENVEAIYRAIGEVLSKYEKEVFSMYMEGATYVEIAKKLGKPLKSVDNALQRIKNKVHEIL